ncbi:MAG: hypothetical protein KC912_11160 [Proteobacteria bacterium]|nr:hypothetical protein [Pseudomonadota bacterium]
MLALAAAALFSTASADDFSEEWRAVLSERRQAHIERLEAYSSAGRFPLNLDQPGPAHMFMDATGSRCAMAELIWQSGYEPLVVETYATQNDVVMAELSVGPLTDWVAISGLTMDEVAFIQEPGFMVGQLDLIDIEPIPAPDLVALERSRRQSHFAMAAQQLVIMNDASLDAAVAALGDRVNERPEAHTWTSDAIHSTTWPVQTPETRKRKALRRASRG